MTEHNTSGGLTEGERECAAEVKAEMEAQMTKESA